jgi:hypothetical protein
MSKLARSDEPEVNQVQIKLKIEAPRPQGGASRKRNVVHIVRLDAAYKGGACGALAGQSSNRCYFDIRSFDIHLKFGF